MNESGARWLVAVDLLWCVIACSTRGELGFGIAAALGFRFGVVLTALVNEWSHLAVARGFGAKPSRQGTRNWLGNRPLACHLLALVPGTPDWRGHLTVRIALHSKRLRAVREGGFALGAVVSLAFAVSLLVSAFGLPTAAFGLATLLALGGAFITDMTPLTPFGSGSTMACGNVTLLGRVAIAGGSAFPSSCRRLLLSMLRVSQMRGAQSGGGAILLKQKGHARKQIAKCVNSKRGDLASKMTKALSNAARGKHVPGTTFVAQTHVRYATAGMTKLEEAHPFCFVDVAARGLRRVTVWKDGLPVVSPKPIETVLTHNGDMDGLRFRNVTLAFPELGPFLERMLGVKNRWSGDSPLLAAAIDLYVTKGMWFESLRLSYYLVVAPAPRDPSSLPETADAAARREALVRAVEALPALSISELERWERLAEAVVLECARQWQAEPDDAPSRRRFREHVVERLEAAFLSDPTPTLPAQRVAAFARAAVAAFFDNDLYVALRKLEPGLLGTFGCVVTSTLEPGSFVAFSRGQPLSLGFHRPRGVVCAVSERAAMKVRSVDGQAAFDERIDLDLCRGEIARVVLGDTGAIQLTLYGISDGREYGADDLVHAGRLVPLDDNPYVSPLPHEGPDRVVSDLSALPNVVRSVRGRWSNDADYVVQSARKLKELLFSSERPKLLLIGITNDLWLAQQFALNLALAFPNVETSARSSNEILVAPERIRLDGETIVLAVSQTGQDFPTLGALLLLQARHPALAERSFVMTGELDSLMGQAVGQSYARGAPFCCKIFSNGSGFRPSEAVLLPVSATQLTLDELLLFLMRNATTTPATYPCAVTSLDVRVLEERRDQSVDIVLPALVAPGPTAVGATMARRVVRRWSAHVLEWIVAFALSVVVLELNVGFGLGLLPSSLLDLLPLPESIRHPLTLAFRQFDVWFYAFLTPGFVWLIRLLQGRPLLHRQGVREVLIGDVGYVHEIAWLFARRLFASSYGLASAKVYSANNQDELVLTHEPVRGTLVLLGLPDRRVEALAAGASAAAMSAKQFNYSRSFSGAGAEIVTVGHGPGIPGLAFHVALPSGAPRAASKTAEQLIEGMFDSWERLLTMQVLLERVVRAVSRFPLFQFDRSRTKDQVFAPTTAAPVSAAAIYQLLSRAGERYDSEHREPLPFEISSSDWRGSAPTVRTTFWAADEHPLKFEP